MDEPAPLKARSLYANSLFGILSWFAPIVLGFISTPVLVSGLGTETYGVYAIILGFLSYSFTFGIGRVASKFVAEYSASGESEKISQTVSATLWLSLAIGVSGALILALITPWVVSEVLLLPAPSQGDAAMGLYIASFTGLMVMISQVFQNALQGIHRFGIYLALTNLGAVMLSIGNIVLAISGYGIPALIAWNLFSVLTIGIGFFAAAVISIPDLRLTFRIESAISRSVIRYGASIIVYQIFANAFFIFERSWIVRRFGPESLTFYFVPMLLGIYLHGLIASVAQVLFPRVNELLSDRDSLARLYRKANRSVIAVVGLISASLIVLGREFLTLWVSEEFGQRSYKLLIVHVITFSLIASIILVWNVAEAYRAPGINVLVTFIWMVLGSTLMIAVGSSNGIEGIALSRLAATVVTMPVIVLIEHRYLGGFMAKHWLSLSLRVGAAIAALAVTQFLIINATGPGWFSLLAAGSAGSAAYVAALWLSRFFTEEEIDKVRSLIPFSRSAVQ